MSYWSGKYWMGAWQPAIGDPGVWGWFIAGSYFACAMIAVAAAFKSRTRGNRFLFFWAMIGVLMLLLGVNKQLDLQSLLREMGRQTANAQGWMEQRRNVQWWFTITFGSSALAAFLFLIFFMRDLIRRFIVAFAGLFVLLLFIITRAASFQHLDRISWIAFFGTRVHWLLEITAIYLILFAGLQEIRDLRDRH